MKLYIRVVISLLLFIMVYGWACPILVSIDDTLLSWLGVLLSFGFPIPLVSLWIRWLQPLLKKGGTDEK